MATRDGVAVNVRPATGEDLDDVLELLSANHLPRVGVAESFGGFFVAESGGEIVGVIGIEPCGEAYGLLRSAAVAEAFRGQGVGARLVERALAAAEEREYQALYLLTTTAEKYFPAFGFVVAERGSAPAEVAATEEFRGACPASATLMVRTLAGA